MTLIRKSWWAALALAAFVGCNSEETTTSDTPATPISVGPAPTAPSAAATDKKADDKKADDKKADDKAETTPAPALPAVEGPKVEAPPATPPKADDKKADDKADAGTLSDKDLAAIKKLPAAEQTQALKQLTCPVSDEALGSMGTPLKVVAEGKTFFLCCKGCQDELKADPKAVVAKLKN